MILRLRIKHLIRGRYVLQYRTNRYIPVWHTLYRWLDFGLMSGCEAWNPVMGPADEMEEFSRRFAVPGDIAAWYHDQNAKRIQFLQKKALAASKLPRVKYLK